MIAMTGIIQHGSISDDAPLLERIRFESPPAAPDADPALLVQIQGHAILGQLTSYHAVFCYRLWLAPDESRGWAEITRPTRDLTDEERATLQTWLVARSWEAWARADVSVRALAGQPAEPMSLPDAARARGMLHVTLAKAVERGAVPAIATADRQLVYLATIDESRIRGRIGVRRRPAQGET